MQGDVHLMDAKDHALRHRDDRARELVERIAKSDEEIATAKENLKAMKDGREGLVASLLWLWREPGQGELFPPETVDPATGEIKDKSTLTIALPGREPVTATFDQVEKALDKLEGARKGPFETSEGSLVPFTLVDCTFNRKTTRRAFEQLAVEKGLAPVIDAIEQVSSATDTLTMEHYKQVEEIVTRPADEDPDHDAGDR